MVFSRRPLGDATCTEPDSGSEAWLLTSSALVFLMVPALAMFYGGAVSSKAVVHTMMLSFVSMVVGAVVWSLVGYSLAFGPGGGVYGGMVYGAFDSSDRVHPGTCISEHVYFVFQMAFNTITIAVISGGVVQRITLHAFALFSVIWTLLVYCPLAHWIFNPEGWLASWGVLDFAGGLVVETASGVSAFVLAFWIGPGQALHGGHGAHALPHSVPFVLLGAGFLQIGWYAFNAGSALAAGYLAGRAFANTHLAACSAMAAWSAVETIFGGERGWFRGRPTAFGAATGAVVGLVAITPACGFISQMMSLLLGVVAAPLSFAATRLLKRSGVDDRLECLACHGLAGAVGILFTGLLASTAEGAPSDGAFYGNGAQFAKQLAGLGVTLALCVVGTSVAYWAVWALCWAARLPVRVPDAHQDRVDAATHGEHAYDISRGGGLGRGQSSISLLLGAGGDAGAAGGHAPLLSGGRHDTEGSSEALTVKGDGEAFAPPPGRGPPSTLHLVTAVAEELSEALSAVATSASAPVAVPAQQQQPVRRGLSASLAPGAAASSMPRDFGLDAGGDGRSVPLMAVSGSSPRPAGSINTP